MSKFGELIQSTSPVLINFYSNNEQEDDTITLKEVVQKIGASAKVIRIDVERNEALANALRIKYNPTYIIYKESEMKWRQSGVQQAEELIEMLEKFV
jgi:thioredoxin 1